MRYPTLSMAADRTGAFIRFAPWRNPRRIPRVSSGGFPRKGQNIETELTPSSGIGAAARGGRARCEVSAPTPIPGSILSVETRTQTIKDRGETITLLNLLTDSGIRTVNLADVTNIRLLDERLDRELREALALLASQQDSQRRQVALHFEGAGRRSVRVGYLTEAPVWKMSYRLVLDEKKAPYLQGWAIVENPTEEDWNRVRLALVSGRPVSFIQDLYQPL